MAMSFPSWTLSDPRFLRHRERSNSQSPVNNYRQQQQFLPEPVDAYAQSHSSNLSAGAADGNQREFWIHSSLESSSSTAPLLGHHPIDISHTTLRPITESSEQGSALSSTSGKDLNQNKIVSLDSRLGFWERSRIRARTDKSSWDYVLRSGLAGGLAGCVAKTAIAPLDRVKILFQTSNVDFKRFAGTPLGVYHAIRHILSTTGLPGLFQGHSATLLRIFPYAGIKFMAYERLDSLIMPTKEMRTPGRLFLAGSMAGVVSVLFTYPLELVRVRLAFQTKRSDRSSLREVMRQLYLEGHPLYDSSQSTSSVGQSIPKTAPMSFRPSMILARIPIINTFIPFYRGFSITILGMIPYAGVSFLTYGTLKRHLPQWYPQLAAHKTYADLSCGAIAGLVSQTASYPFEVVRRRMQVGGMKGTSVSGVTWQDAVKVVWKEGRFRGFFVGLSIGYVKVIPMSSISFAVWQFAKRAMEI